MGILELHFHESDFDFSPSIGTGGDADHDSSGEDGTMVEPDTEDDGGPGALLAFGLLIVVGVLVGLRRRRSGGEDGDGEYGEDEKISISA